MAGYGASYDGDRGGGYGGRDAGYSDGGGRGESRTLDAGFFISPGWML